MDRKCALNRAFEFVYKSETDGDYHEFGVYEGASLIRAIKADAAWKERTASRISRRFFAYDSFRGLPELSEHDRLENYNIFHEGQFSTSIDVVKRNLEKAGLSDTDIEFVVGHYSDILQNTGVARATEGNRVAVAHIDCDLYASAIECLRFLDGRFSDGAIVLFDDWFCFRGRPDKGVRRAFREWHSATSYKVTEYFTYSWAGKAFIVTTR